ncbi:MAG: hypothetical protein U1A24_15190 [Cypionkella sp.]|uniref:hypothetical protein n=1 Tax=Cypionkella sp. TaxID=2811411 RepID=UPI002AB8D2C0|nr:hypothetical protein [Cypionkella sp.]MDZ4311888.1 hypothetical protein [Cypionkella sp.]
MKPAFALDFRDETISLLHRSGSGWQLVGAVPLDTPDLTEALGYLRATALGLSPRGMATKLVIPNDQILYLNVHAPGPDEAARHAQVMAALEGRTPYDVADLAFDYTGTGPDVQVAVIAKETLAEAESFAAEHRLNPIAFVAAPEPDSFAAEPWFGLSAMAPSLIAAGAQVERDSSPVMIVARGFGSLGQSADAATEAAQQTAAPELEDPPEPEAALTPEVGVEPVVVEAKVVAEAEPAIEPEAVVEPEVAIAPDDLPEPEFIAEPEQRLAAKPAFEAAPSEAAPFENAQEDIQPAAVVPDQPQPRKEPARNAAPATVTRDTPPASSFDDDNALIAALADTLSSPIPQPDRPPPAPPAPRKPMVEVEEAPMALDVPDDAGDAEETEPAEPQGAEVIRAAISAQAARVIDPAIADDLPPSPAPAALGAFSSRRQGNDPLPHKALPVAPIKAGVPRPAGAKPLSAMPAGGTPRALPPKPDLAGKVAKPAKAGLRGLSALVTAPNAAGAKPRSKVAIPSALPPLKPADAAGANATRPQAPRPTAARGPSGFAAREPMRGKPRYLGLMLTAVLLFLLAMIAAWSSYSMGAWNTGADAPVQVGATNPDGSTAIAAADMPDADEEMLADMQDPTELSDTASVSDSPVPAEQEVASPDAVDLGGTSAEPAPTLDVTAETAAQVNPTAGTDDEIFLASMDAAPSSSDPLSLASPQAQGDVMPAAQPAPPPYGTVYQFEPNGAITPTPEGIITPEGVLLRAGKPSRVPTARTEAVVAAVAAAKPAVTEAAPASSTTSAAAAPAVFADPALAGKKPKTRPEGLTPPAAADQGALAPEADSRLAGLRPTPRPSGILSAGRQAQQASAAASLTAQAEALTQEAALTGGSKLAVAISRKPAPRPRDLSRAVEAAVAAVARQPDPEAAVEPQPRLAAIPEKNASPEDDGEPDVVSAAPKIPTKATVAKQATFKNAINLSKLNLIGVYGTQSKRYALIRTPAGRYKKVRVGDTIDGGGRVAAITATEVRYQKGGRLVALAMPKG